MKPLMCHACRLTPGVLAALSLLAACGASASTSSTAAAPPATGARTASIVVPAADRFTPAVTSVVSGGTITFHNGDTDAHTVTSLPGDPEPFDMTLQPGATQTLVLHTGGGYRYYCKLHARYDASTDQVAALPNADHPNEPMSGVLFVSPVP